jgi:hypothetical protein
VPTFISKYLYTFTILVGTIIFLRPFSFVHVGDAIIYFKGTSEMFSGVDLYEIDRADFGTRFFNGPVWGLWLWPLTVLPESIGLLIFRLLSVLASAAMFFIVSKRTLKREYPLYLLFFLMFSIRMNTNLGQGAAIAYLCFVLSAYLLFNFRTLQNSLYVNIAAALLFVFASNYKPQLGVLLFAFAVLRKRWVFISSSLIAICIVEYLLALLKFQVSYLDWLKLLLERTSRLYLGGSQNIFGPWSLLGEFIDFNVESFMVVVNISLLVSLYFISRSAKVRVPTAKDFELSLVFLSFGSLIVAYSPLQDSFLITCIYFSWLLERKFRNYSILNSIVLSLFFLPTEQSLRNYIILIGVTAVIAHFSGVVDIKLYLPTSLTILALQEYLNYDHKIYDLAGVGVILASFIILKVAHKQKNIDEIL